MRMSVKKNTCSFMLCVINHLHKVISLCAQQGQTVLGHPNTLIYRDLLPIFDTCAQHLVNAAICNEDCALYTKSNYKANCILFR